MSGAPGALCWGPFLTYLYHDSYFPFLLYRHAKRMVNLALLQNTMVSASLHVAVYKPQDHSKAHWAIFLDIIEEGEHSYHLYQAVGDQGALELDIREGVHPNQSARLERLVFVSDIDTESEIEDVRSIIECQPINNYIANWTCQDFVMESLEALDIEGLLDETCYTEAKEELEALFVE